MPNRFKLLRCPMGSTASLESLTPDEKQLLLDVLKIARDRSPEGLGTLKFLKCALRTYKEELARPACLVRVK